MIKLIFSSLEAAPTPLSLGNEEQRGNDRDIIDGGISNSSFHRVTSVYFANMNEKGQEWTFLVLF